MTWRLPPTLVSLCLAGLLIGSMSAARADTTTEAIIGGTLIHRVRTAWAGISPEKRAAQVQQRLNMALALAPLHATDFSVGQVQNDWCVLFRGKRFLTADAQTAKQDHSNPQALARQWSRYLSRVLPSLTSIKGK